MLNEQLTAEACRGDSLDAARSLKQPAGPAAGAGALSAGEIDVIGGMDPPQRALFAEIAHDRPLGSPEPLPDAWQRLADVPGVAAFARWALTAARVRAAAIQSGKIPYLADKAFAADEVATLGRAARIALLRDEPWLPELLDRLLPDITMAPTAARTLPSQALLYEIARAVQDFPTPEAVTALRAVRATVRHKGVPRQLERMLKKIENALADRTEVALRLPSLGFGSDGMLRIPIGGHHHAVIAVADDVELTWRGPDGKPLRGVPAAIRRDHPDAVREARGLVKRVRAHLTTLTRALEAGVTTEAVQPYQRWRETLAGHPLAATVVSRLIWELEVSPGQWLPVLSAGQGTVLRDQAGRLIPVPCDDAAIRLWHPIRSAPDEVRAWRNLLDDHGVRQPFKQAYREIYLLTPAELETRVYSNRFAAHLVHYRRLYALFKARGWVPDRLLGPWDSGDEGAAARAFAAGEWRAAFRHEYVQWAETFELASTDQVRFAHREDGAWREVPLADVPAVVFSEAMRDVDLFVGVTSIAADPDWTDRGEDRYARYWRSAGFGELTATAQVRRDALARILPRTKIAGRCTVADRYLTVRGDLRTYKIHLGSANILMEPDDSYLCIVLDQRGSGGKVFLPFEDERLSLILSKAFLLADDANITDMSILRQIMRGA